MVASSQIKLLCLMGPTASGKSALALSLADRLGGEIVCVDAMTIYKELSIGTAKPSAAERQLCPHHLLDIVTPDVRYSVARFVSDAWVAIQAIASRGRVPILVGGTMMYFNALLQGLSPIPDVDSSVRLGVLADFESEGLPALWAALLSEDPEMAKRLSSRDVQRIMRALEVVRSTGRSLAYWQDQPLVRLPCQALSFGLMPSDRDWLWVRIAQRLSAMLSSGWVDEVRAVQAQFPGMDLPCLRSVGYRQIVDFLAGKLSEDALFDAVFFATRRYAKRQKTWLRRGVGVHLLEPKDLGLEDAVERAWSSFSGGA